MKDHNLIFILTFILIFWLNPNVVSGDTIVWSGVKVIDTNQVVYYGQTLKILSGTTVTANGPFKIEVSGNVIAEGTEENPILFTASDTIGLNDSATIAGGWHGIHLLNNNSGQSRFSYCTFEYGKANVPGSWTEEQGGFDQLEGNQGGAFWISGYKKTKFDHCTFSSNYSRTSGGVIYCEKAQSLELLNCSFIQNKTLVYGGGLYAVHNDSLLITGSSFIQNDAWYTYLINDTVTHFISNGAAIFLATYPGTPWNLINYNTFYNNHSITIITDMAMNSIVENNIFANNLCRSALSFNVLESEHVAFNNTIANNYYDMGFGIPGVMNFSRDLRFYNNILWNNLSDSIRENDMAIVCLSNIPDINYNLIWEGRAPGSNMLKDDPKFVNPAPGFGLESNGWEYDWSLQDDSPAVNAGTPDTTGMNLPPTDLAGNPRIYGNRIDMGAYENQHVWVKINDSPAFAKQIKVYPNPGIDRIMVTLPENTQEAWIELLDGTGQRVLLERVYANLCIFTPTGLTPGIYFYRIYNQDQVFKKGKWVKL